MQLTHYLTEKDFLVPLQSATKKEILRELVDQLVASQGLKDRDAILHAVEEREKTASTFLPMGIAVPHARVTGIDDIVAVLGISQLAVTENTQPQAMQAQVFCLFLSPVDDKQFSKHLKFLAKIAAVFSDTDFIQTFSVAPNAVQAFQLLQKRERQIDVE